MYKFEKQLKTKATEFIEELKKKSLSAHYANETLREYNIKIRIENIHDANLYYSGKKNSYTLVLNEIKDIGIRNLVSKTWESFYELNNTFNSFETKQSSLFEKYPDSVHIYVDGSYQNNGFGYAFAVIENGEAIFKEKGCVPLPIFRTQNNIGGELYGVLRALEWCKKGSKTKVVIYHDYNGISKFALGEWKGKTESTVYYANQINKLEIKPIFVKVAAHTNNKWNNLVDELAKQGAASDPVRNEVEEIQTELELNRLKIANGFADYLLLNGIDAEVVNLNNKYADRIKIKLGSSSKILMDIYDCKKRKINDPYIANIKPEHKKELLLHYNQYLLKNNLR